MDRLKKTGAAIQAPSLWQCYCRAFLACGITSFFIFLPFYLLDGGFFHYAGDFNGQQITFYRYASQLVWQNAPYAWAADLGSGAVNAYSFYLWGSPFFWLALLLPPDWLPYCMAPLLVLKFAVAGGGAMLYLRRYVKDPNLALVGSCLYALSGFTVYNVFFNHFVDVVALFPYLLWSLDEAVYQRRRGLFALFAALNLVNNYFFFAGQITFLVIYFVCKCITGEYRLTGRLFTVLAVESLLAAAMGSVLAWPAMLSLAQNPRTVDPAWGWELLTYAKPQQYLAILFSWVLPPDCPYEPSIWTEGLVKWTSMTAYLPLCSLAGVVAYWRGTRGGSTKAVLGTCAVFALIPGLNSLFYAMNSSYYARWFYMPLLLMCMATVQALKNPKIDLHTGLRPVFWVMAACVLFFLIPAQTTDKDGSASWHLGIANNPAQLGMVLAFGVAGLVIFGRLWAHRQKKPVFSRRLLAAVLAFSCVFSIAHIAAGKFGQWENDTAIRSEYQGAAELGALLPAGSYRVDAYECRDNLGPWMNKSCIQYFGSTVAPGILEFYPELGAKRDVRSNPEWDMYALRSFLGVRYCIVPKEKQADWEAEQLEDWGLTSYAAADYLVYENQNDPGLGLTYDYYMTQEQWEKIPKSKRANLLLRAIVLDEETIQTYGHLLTPLPDEELTRLDRSSYEADCAQRKKGACRDFTMQGNGFSAAISLEKETLVCFQVPWEDGFTAEVNGAPAEIIPVDHGLMAVVCPAGDNQITVTYHTPGLRESILVCISGITLYILYLILFYLRRRRQIKTME